MDKFKHKYRIDSTRLGNWDYGKNGAYFVTICTGGRECYFGEIVDGEMNLSDMGLIAQNNLLSIKGKFPFAILDSFVLMPNHIHCVLVIDKKIGDSDNNPIINDDTDDPFRKNNPMKSENLSKIIRWYKARTTFEIRKTNPYFSWQSSFYDHIIKEDNMYKTIINYIENNPKNWDKDKLHKGI